MKRKEERREKKGEFWPTKVLSEPPSVRVLALRGVQKMPQAKFPLSVFGTEVAVPVVRSNKYSLVSSLLNCDTSAHSLHAKKIERQLILVSSMCAKFGVIAWSFEWARANFTTEIRLHRIILPIMRTSRIGQNWFGSYIPFHSISGTWPQHVSQPGIPSRIGRCKKNSKIFGSVLTCILNTYP